MPQFDVTGPDGKTYRVNTPEGATQQQAIAYAAQRFYGRSAQPTQAAPTQPQEEDPGALDYIQSFTTDIPMRVLRGAITGVRGLTNLAGADNPLSEGLQWAEEGMSDYLISDTARIKAQDRTQELEGQGFFETLADLPGLLVDDPLLLADVVGTAVPAILAGAVSGGTGTAATLTGLGVGAGMGAGFVKESIYDATVNELLSNGVSREAAEEAASEAQSYAGGNGDMIGLGAVLGAVAARTGLEPAIARSVVSRIAGRSVADAAMRTTAREALEEASKRGFVRGAAAEAPLEGLQGGQEQLAANLALRRQGFDVDLMEGVGSAAAFEGGLGGVAGGLFGAREGSRARGTMQGLAAEEARLQEAAAAPEAGSREERVAERARVYRDDYSISEEDAVRIAEQDESEREAALSAREARRTAAAAGSTGPAEGTTGEPTDGVAGAGVSPDMGPGAEGAGVAGGPAAGAGVSTPGGMGGADVGAGVATGTQGATPAPLIDMTQPKTVRTARAMELAEEGVQRPEFRGLGLTSNQRNMAKNMLRDGRFLDEADPVRAAVQTVLNKTQRAAYEVPAPGEIYTVKTAADAYIARQTAQDTSENPQLEQFIANNTTEINAEFVRRQQEAAPPPTPEAPPTVADTLTEEKVAVEPAPVVEEAPVVAPVAEEAPVVAPVREPTPAEVAQAKAKELYPYVGPYPSNEAIRFIQATYNVNPVDQTEPLSAEELATMPPEERAAHDAGIQWAQNFFGVVPAPVPVAEEAPAPTGESPGTQRTVTTINGKTSAQEGPTPKVAPTPPKRPTPPAPVVEPEPLVTEEEEVDYEEHPDVQGVDARYEEATDEIGSVENMKELRKLITRFKREGLIDADDVSEIEARISDVDKTERLDEGMDALGEALENQRDNQRDEVIAELEAEGAPIPAPEPEATPEPAVELVTDEERAAVEKIAKRFNGVVVYLERTAPGEEPIGLIRGTNVLNGKAVYLAIKGESFFSKDVDSSNINFASAGITPDEATALRAKKAELEAADATKHASDPFVKYDSDGLAFSASVPEPVRNTLRAWKGLILPGTKLYITDIGDIAADKANYTGPHRAVASAALDPNEAGSTRRIDPGEHYIALDISTYGSNPRALLEVAAHEMGHVHDKEVFQNAPQETKDALRAEHRAWVLKNTAKGKTAADLVAALRAPAMGELTTVPDIPAEQLTAYWKSFSEWYADQMARWAVSDEKPLSLVDKFFADLVNTLRKFYKFARGQGFLPTETFKKFVEKTTTNLDLSNTTTAIESAPTEEQTLADQISEARDLGYITDNDFAALNKALESGKFPEAKITADFERRKEKQLAAPSAAKKTAAAGIKKATTKISTGLEKARLAADRDAMEGVGEAASGHNAADWVKGLPGINFLGNMLEAQKIMKALPLDGLLDWAETKLGPKLAKGLRDAGNLIQREDGAIAATRKALKPLLDEESEFIQKHGVNALSNARSVAREDGIDLTQLTTGMAAQDAYAADPIWKFYAAKLKDPNISKKDQRTAESRQRTREASIDGGLTVWNALGDLPGGQELYSKIRKAYQDLYKIRKFYVESNMEQYEKQGLITSDVLKAYKRDRERLTTTLKAPDPADAHKIYSDVPLGLFPKEYFPYKRFGNYSLRIKKGLLKGVKGKDEPVLRFYEDKADRDADLRMFAKQLGVSPQSQSYFSISDDVAADFSDTGVLSAATIFKKSMEILNSATGSDKTLSETQRRNLQGQLYDLYLLGSPEGAISRSFIRSKGRAGYSADVLRVDASTFMSYSNELAKLRFAPQVRQAIDEAVDSAESIEGDKDPVTVEKAELLRRFAAEVERRATQQLEGGEESYNKLAAIGSNLAFYSFLTTAASAALQQVSIPVRVAPRLWADYGVVKGSNTLNGWAMQMIGVPALDKETQTGSLRNKSIISSNPLFRRAYDSADRSHNLFAPLSAFTLGDRATTRGLASTAMRVNNFVSRVSTFLFDSSERLSREVTFMAAFELEYDKLKGSELNQKDREAAAVKKAIEITYDTLGNYGAYNVPALMQGNALVTALFQFKNYAVITTRFFVTNMRTIVRSAVRDKTLTPGEGRRALKELTGVLTMGFMFHGLIGNPLWSLGMLALGALGLADSDEDDEDYNPYLDGNPQEYVKQYITDRFGEPTFEGADGNTWSLGDLMLRGPASTLSGWDIGSRSSLDLLPMWFRSTDGNESWKEAVGTGLLDNLPFISNMASMGDGIVLMYEGDMARGIERGFPLAIVRSWAKGYRLSSEGVVSSSGDVILSRDSLSDSQIVGTVLGINPTELAELQQFQRLAYTTTSGMDTERADLMSKFAETRRRMGVGLSDRADYDEVLAEIVEYNSTIPPQLPHLRVDYNNLVSSIKALPAEAKGDIFGGNFTEDEARYLRELAPPVR